MHWSDFFTDPEFFEARAIVFSKMGQHRQALEIYVFKLEDYVKAEESVLTTYESSKVTAKIRFTGIAIIFTRPKTPRAQKRRLYKI